MDCYVKMINDTSQTVIKDGVKINHVPLGLDQTNLKFKSNGFLEFVIDDKRDVQYMCDLYPPKEIQFCQDKSGKPIGFYSVPLSYDPESKDKYLGCITNGNILDDKKNKTYWLVDKPELGRQVIKEISDDPSRARTIGSPFDGEAYFCGDFVIWLEKNTANPVMTSVMGYNSMTKKVFPIDVSLTWKSAIQAGSTCVYWVDSGNPNENEYTVKGFDLASMKPIETGISLKYNFPYKYNSSNSLNGKFERDNPIYSMWCISGDDVVYEDVGNNNSLMMFSKMTNKTVGFSKSKYTPFYPKIIWWTWKDENDPNSKSYYRYTANHSFFTDTNSKRIDPFCVWASKQLDETYTFSYLKKSQLQGKPGLIENVKPLRLVGVTGDWFLWIEQDTTNQKNAIIKAYNFVTKQTKNLGIYELNIQYYPDITCFDNTIAWSAYSEGTGYDIFYTRLP
ncbi:MAG: hypothetical protein KA140_04575 [Caldisericia bacterium]|nr:hypothetical protein [Caldisericia bacterium]